MADTAKWYVVHTYSGYENTVKATIEQTVENLSLSDLIHEISIPMETVTEMTEKGPNTYDRKLYPGYVLVKMVMSDETWYAINSIRGVTGFIGSGTKPTPLTEDEVLQMGVEKKEVILGYEVGDEVTINDGLLANRTGIVDSIDVENDVVLVTVDMMNRKQTIDLRLDQVDPIMD